MVFIDNGKGRAGDVIRHPKPCRKAFGKHGFSGAQIPCQAKDLSPLGVFTHFFSQSRRFRRAVGFPDFFHNSPPVSL